MASEPDLLAELADQLHALDAEHLRRRRRILSTAQGPHVTVGDRTLRNFCSNDYLGLASDPRLVAAAQSTMTQYGLGSGASQLVCGHSQVHEALEQRFASFVGLPAALLFGTGYLANLGVIPALLRRGDAVFADKLNHASLNEACLLSRADFQRFPHNDCAALARQLEASKAKRKLIAVDAVYSMDGDLAPLADLLQLAEQHNAWLYVDDAHGFGVLGEGRGSLAHWQLRSSRLIYLATLGKAAGGAGALVGAHPLVVEWLLNKAKPAIYTTAAPALLAASALAAIDIIEHEPARRARLFANIGRLRAGLAGEALLPSQTPIQPLRMASSEAAMQVSAQLWDAGCWVAAIRPPTVATARLRITLSASHCDDDVDTLDRYPETATRLDLMPLFIDTLGHGDDLVLIHGWGIHGAVWQRVAEQLAQHYCVHIVDLPGCGNSAMVEPYTLDTLAATLDRCFPLPVHVLGWSLGGAIGMQWALSQPAKLRSLTLCASSPRFMQAEGWPHATPAATLAAFARSLSQDYAATLEMFLGLQVMGSRDGRAVLRSLQASLASRPGPQVEALMAGLEILISTDLRNAVAEIACPMLLQYGEQDRMTPPEAGRWLAQASQAELVMHTGAGHAPFISHEADFIAAQHAFLQRL